MNRLKNAIQSLSLKQLVHDAIEIFIIRASVGTSIVATALFASGFYQSFTTNLAESISLYAKLGVAPQGTMYLNRCTDGTPIDLKSLPSNAIPCPNSSIDTITYKESGKASMGSIRFLLTMQYLIGALLGAFSFVLFPTKPTPNSGHGNNGNKRTFAQTKQSTEQAHFSAKTGSEQQQCVAVVSTSERFKEVDHPSDIAQNHSTKLCYQPTKS